MVIGLLTLNMLNNFEDYKNCILIWIYLWFCLTQVDEINSGTAIHVVCPTQSKLLLKLPEHQQAWYWPPKPEYPISSIRRVKLCCQYFVQWLLGCLYGPNILVILKSIWWWHWWLSGCFAPGGLWTSCWNTGVSLCLSLQMGCHIHSDSFNTLRPRQNGIFQTTFSNAFSWMKI